MVKNPPANVDSSSCRFEFDRLEFDRLEFDPWVGRSPGEENITSHSSILAGKSYGQRSREDYSPWGHKRVTHDLVSK